MRIQFLLIVALAILPAVIVEAGQTQENHSLEMVTFPKEVQDMSQFMNET